MKKIVLTFILIITTATSVFAAKVPDNVRTLIKKDFAKADFRFDGLITLPDGTIYLPLYPALVKKPEFLEVKSTVPAGKTLAQKPDVVILNNDFALLKLLIDSKGRKTVINMKDPPIEIRTGLLPQGLLVPSGLVVPDSIKGIIGNLQISTSKDDGIKVQAEPFLENKTKKSFQTTKDLVAKVPQLDNKLIYVSTCFSRNIQVVQGEANLPSYALSQRSIPVDMAATPDEKFLLVTTYGKTFVDVISLADEKVIRQLDLTTQGGEIVIDALNNRAYVSSAEDSLIYVIDLTAMVLKQKIKVKGMCERIILSTDGTKLFYADKKKNDVWVVELDNNYAIKNIGNFPNVSKIAYTQGKIYITSRTKDRIAIIDYASLSLIKEMEVDIKPLDMLVFKNNLYVLCAQNNIVQVFDTINDEIINTISLNTKGFSTKIYKVKNTNIALITDTKIDKYSVLDLNKNQVIKTNFLEIPVSKIEVLTKTKK